MTTTSAARWASSVTAVGTLVPISMPSSARAAADSGFTASAGAVPQERTWTAPAATCSIRPAAIGDLPLLLEQTKRTLGWSALKFMGCFLSVAPAADPAGKAVQGTGYQRIIAP